MSDPAPCSGSTRPALDAHHCRSIEWYHEGQTRIVEANGMRIEVRFVGRKGRRARIAIVAPLGAAFQAIDP